MRSAILFGRARGLFPLLAILLGTVALVLVLHSRVIWVPGNPEGTLVQTWLPLILSVVAARVCFDASGGLAWPGRPMLHLLEFFWLTGAALMMVALAAPARGPAASSVGEVHAAVAVGTVTSLCYLLSLRLDFAAVASVGCVAALVLILAAGPVLRSGIDPPLLWVGGRYEYVVACGLVLLAAALRAWLGSTVQPRRL